jgi:hypothetical protein
MLRNSKVRSVICILIIMSISSCYPGSSATPVQEIQPIATATTNSANPPVDQTWFGMQLSPDLWQVEEIQDALYQRGSMTHRLLVGCRAWILSEDPVYISGYAPDWTASTYEQITAPGITMDLWRVKDQEGNLRDTYFDVHDTTGRTGHDDFRLAYFLIEMGEDPIQCLEAVHTVLITIDPGLFPDLDTGQG